MSHTINSWKMTPLYPSDDQVNAAVRAYEEYMESGNSSQEGAIKVIYKAMWENAPELVIHTPIERL